MNKITIVPGYVDAICLVILLIIFFIALFITQGIMFVVDMILLAGTAALLGRTMGKMTKIENPK